MSAYEQAMFDFITTPDNFSAACDIVEHFQTIKQQLTARFINKVAAGIREELSAYPGWKLYVDEQQFYKYAKLALYTDAFCLPGTQHAVATICLERLYADSYYGILVDKDKNKVDYEDFARYIRKVSTEKWRTDSYWPLWEYTGINFNNWTDTRRLQPDLQPELVKQVITPFMETFELFRQPMEEYFAVHPIQ